MDYPTSDGFLFDGTGIKEKKSYGLLVNHNGHMHVIPYEQLIQSKWEYLIPAEYKKLLRTLTMVEKIKHRPRQHKILQKKMKKSLRKRPIWHSSWELMKV
ncbi:pneumococcal-type histidine triad protein [Streptococcus anginosus]|uniref:pneumococcal-type histidine triad protein n=1 Tax=Streptococcus anginosus TaxID=1328 RepID=UPI003BF4DDC5